MAGPAGTKTLRYKDFLFVFLTHYHYILPSVPIRIFSKFMNIKHSCVSQNFEWQAVSDLRIPVSCKCKKVLCSNLKILWLLLSMQEVQWWADIDGFLLFSIIFLNSCFQMSFVSLYAKRQKVGKEVQTTLARLCHLGTTTCKTAGDLIVFYFILEEGK